MLSNRKMKRELQKKLGNDFPLDQFLALVGHYNARYGWSKEQTTVFLLKVATLDTFKEILLEGGFNDEFECVGSSYSEAVGESC